MQLSRALQVQPCCTLCIASHCLAAVCIALHCLTAGLHCFALPSISRSTTLLYYSLYSVALCIAFRHSVVTAQPPPFCI